MLIDLVEEARTRHKLVQVGAIAAPLRRRWASMASQFPQARIAGDVVGEPSSKSIWALIEQVFQLRPRKHALSYQIGLPSMKASVLTLTFLLSLRALAGDGPYVMRHAERLEVWSVVDEAGGPRKVVSAPAPGGRITVP